LQVETPAQELAKSFKALDDVLAKGGNDETALMRTAASIIEDLQSSGVAQCFGKARSIPKRIYSLEELRLNKIDAAKLLSPDDETLNDVEAGMQAAFVAGAAASSFVDYFDLTRPAVALVTMVFVLGVDQVGYMGGLRALAVDTAARVVSATYRCAPLMVSQHGTYSSIGTMQTRVPRERC
jgi:hypothetical protein